MLAVAATRNWRRGDIPRTSRSKVPESAINQFRRWQRCEQYSLLVIGGFLTYSRQGIELDHDIASSIVKSRYRPHPLLRVLRLVRSQSLWAGAGCYTHCSHFIFSGYP
tara:strand:- start:199 stop:522 length:324 start_codon:yes stop_codon:yes gene_type:complete